MVHLHRSRLPWRLHWWLPRCKRSQVTMLHLCSASSQHQRARPARTGT